MVFVRKGSGDSADSMIRKFTRKFQDEGMPMELKKREFGSKPSATKKYRKQLKRKFARFNNYG